MSGDRPDTPGSIGSAAASLIAGQSTTRYTQIPTTVHSCNRLGRVGKLPFHAVIFGRWWRRRAHQE